MSWLHWEGSWSYLEECITGGGDASKLEEVLRRWKVGLQEPLRYPGPAADAMAQVKANQVVVDGILYTLAPAFVERVLKVSKDLELNEVMTVELLHYANERLVLFHGMELEDVAVQLFYDQRRNCLSTLLGILQGSNQDSSCPAIRPQLRVFCNELISGDLTMNLISKSKELAVKLSTETSESKKQLILRESQLLSECIFYVFYGYVAGDNDLNQLVSVIDEWCKLNDRAPSQSNEIFQILYTLSFAVCAALRVDAEIVDSRTGAIVENQFLANSNFTKGFNDTLTKATFSMSGFILLPWYSFLRTAPATNAAAKVNLSQQDVFLNKMFKEKKALVMLRKVLESLPFSQDYNKEAYAAIVHGFLPQIFTPDQIYWERNENEDSLIDLLRCIGLAYKSYPELIQNIWKTDIEDFLRYTAGKLSRKTFSALIITLADLASDENSACNLFTLLKQNAFGKYITWDNFFVIFKKYAYDFSENFQAEDIYSMRVKILPEDVESLTAILKLLESVAKHSEEIREQLADYSHQRPIDWLCFLLKCSIPPTLKGSIFLVLASFAKSSQLIPKIWQQVVSIPLYPLPGQTTASITSCMKFEIEEERKSWEYPHTLGFLQFIYEIATYCGAYGLSILGDVQYFQNCIRFISDVIFTKFDPSSRGYKNPSDQWLIASRSLRVFVKLVEQVKLSLGEPSALPSFEVVKLVMRDAEVFKKLMYILQTGCDYQTYRNQQGGEYFEESICLSLQLLYHISRIENLNADISGGNIFSNSLYELIAKDKRGIPSIACLVQYPPHDVPFFAIKLLHDLSLKQKNAKLLDIILDSNMVQPVLAAFAGRLGTYESIASDESLGLGGYPIAETIRYNILQFLLSNLEENTGKVSLTHFFMGYNLYNPEVSEIDNPAIPSCIQGLIGMLQTQDVAPQMASLAYELLYRLASDPIASIPLLHFFRKREFLKNQFAYVFSGSRIESDVSLQYELAIRGYLLKIIAIVLHVNRASDEAKALTTEIIDIRRETLLRRFDESVELIQPPHLSIEELERFKVNTKHGVQFDITELSNYVSMKYTRENLPLGMDVEMDLEQTELDQEIHYILESAVKFNEHCLLLHSQFLLISGWSEAIEVVITHQPKEEFYNHINRWYQVIEFLLEKYLQKSLQGRTEILEKISRCASFCFAKIRQQSELDVEAQRFEIPVDLLLRILKKLIQCILQTSSKAQIKSNLYVSLTYFLQTISKPLSLRGNSTQEHYQTQVEQGACDLLAQYSEKLMYSIVPDAAQGADMITIIPFALLEILLKFDKSLSLLGRMMQSGAFYSLLSVIKANDKSLQGLMSKYPGKDSMKSQYVYQSVMSFITTALESKVGCNAIVETEIIPLLSSCQFIDMYPESLAVTTTTNNWVPNAIARYNSIINPTLTVVLGLLAKVPTNTRLVHQVLDMIKTHDEVISHLLKDARLPQTTMDSLERLFLLTGIFYNLFKYQPLLMQKLEGKRQSFVHMITSLSLIYCSKSRRPVLPSGTGSVLMIADAVGTTKYESLLVEIQRNILGCLRILMDENSMQPEQSAIQVLFSSRVGIDDTVSSQESMATSWRDPPLDVLFECLRDSLQQYQYNRNFQMKTTPQSALNGSLAVSSTQSMLHAQNQSDLFYSIETCLYVLTKHLQYYLGPSSPIAPSEAEHLKRYSVQFFDPNQATAILAMIQTIEMDQQPNILYLLTRKLKEILNIN